MRPVSDALLTTVTGSHHVNFRARVVTDLPTGTDPDGTEIPVGGGDVQLDANADVRSTLDLITDGTGMFPRSAADLLAPFGNEIFVERGVRHTGAGTEWVSQGYFRIYTPEQDSSPNGPIRISARDRMSGIVDARLVAPVQFTAPITKGSVVEQLVGEVYPTVVIEWDDATDDEQLGRALIAEEDRYKFLLDLVTSAGKVFYFDHRGVLVIKDPPDPGEPVFVVSYGKGGVLLELSRRVSREGVYNAVVATGEAADTTAPAYALAVDANPSSPTYYHGENVHGRTFGKVPRFYSSPFITQDGQAFTAAESLLRKSLGLPYNADFTAVPNPALEPLDPVRVRHPGGSETHVLDRVTIPLSADQPLAATTREQSLVVIGAG